MSRALSFLARALIVLVLVSPFILFAQPTHTSQAISQKALEPHGMGLNLPTLHFQATAPDVAPSGLPASVNLSQYLPAIGDQGDVGSCASWAIGYYLRGWYAEKNGDYPVGGFAPMSIYSRIVNTYDQGQDNGSTLVQANGEVHDYGVTPQAQYAQGNYDYVDLPTPTEAASAFLHRSSAVHEVYQAPLFGTSSPQGVIEAELAAGTPVVIGFLVYQEYENYGLFSGPVQAPQTGEYVYGGHANIAYGYTAQGLLVRNQWGTGWGHGGDGVLSWAYVNATVEEVAAMDVPVPPAPVPVPSPIPSPVGPNLVSWPNPQPAQLPAALPAGVYKEEIIVTDSYGRVRAMAVVAAQRKSH